MPGPRGYKGSQGHHTRRAITGAKYYRIYQYQDNTGFLGFLREIPDQPDEYWLPTATRPKWTQNPITYNSRARISALPATIAGVRGKTRQEDRP